MDAFFLLLILVLGFIGYQIYRRNELRRAEIIIKGVEKKQIEDDELLKKLFPHIFLQERDSIRQYWRRIQEMKTPDSPFRTFGNEWTWESIKQKLSERIAGGKLGQYGAIIVPALKTDDKEALEKSLGEEIATKIIVFHKIEKEQKEIVEKERKRREITEEELNYILYLFWKEVEREESSSGLSEFYYPMDSLKRYFEWFSKKQEVKK